MTGPEIKATSNKRGRGLKPESTVTSMQSFTTSNSTSTIIPAEQQINHSLLELQSKSAVSAATVVLIIGIAEVIGYAFDIAWIKHPIDDAAIPSGMMSGAAVSFVLSALALLLLAGKPRLWRRTVSISLGAIVFAAGCATFLEHVGQFDWGLAYTLVQPASGAPLSFPGPMLPDTASSFVLLGLAIMLARLKIGPIFPSQISALLIGLPNLMIIVCFFCGMEHLCAYFGCFKFSPVTSLMFVTATYTILMLSPDQGITNFLVRDTTGGTIFRRGLLGAFFLLWLLPLRSILIAWGTATQILDATIANIITGAIGVFTVGGYVLWCVKKVDHITTEKSQVAELLKESILTNLPQQNYKLVCLKCGKEFSYAEEMTVCPDDGTELSRLLDELKPGSMFAQRYVVESMIGSGGMSTVYRVEHVLMKKQMALKLLHAHLLSNSKAVQRFQREAHAASQFNHPNLLTIHDFGITSAGQPYLVMDYLEGCSLDEFVRTNGAMQWPEAARVVMWICDGLAAMHDADIVHRDLKPANVMLSPEGNGDTYTARIVDFGLAKSLEGDMFQDLTRTGEVFGSPLYISPEACNGRPVDHRADIYAVGCILYFCLTGKPPFRGETIMETLTKHLSEPAPAIDARLEVPVWLEGIILVAMEKDPNARFPSARDLQGALKSGLSSYAEASA